MKRNIYIISIIFGFFVTLISINKSSASCTITGGVIDNGFLTDAGNDFSCFTAPDLYEIVAYEMYLCSSAPKSKVSNVSVVFPAVGAESAHVEVPPAGIILPPSG